MVHPSNLAQLEELPPVGRSFVAEVSTAEYFEPVEADLHEPDVHSGSSPASWEGVENVEVGFGVSLTLRDVWDFAFAKAALDSSDTPKNRLQAGVKGLPFAPCQMDAAKFWDVLSTPTTPGPSPRADGLPHMPLLRAKTNSVHWTVDGRKLESHEKQILSPEFQLDLPGVGLVPFRLMILAKETRGKGGKGFSKAKGRARLFIKCGNSVLPEAFAVAFRVRVGSKSKVLRGHEFMEHSCCPLQEGHETWDLLSVVEKVSTSFEVHVEVLHP